MLLRQNPKPLSRRGNHLPDHGKVAFGVGIFLELVLKFFVRGHGSGTGFLALAHGRGRGLRSKGTLNEREPVKAVRTWQTSSQCPHRLVLNLRSNFQSSITMFFVL